MRPGLSSYQFWFWEIPTAAGGVDRVELSIGMFGRERITLNGKEIANCFSLRFRNSYSFATSDGKVASLLVEVDWERLALPKCTLTVGGQKIPLKEGEERVNGESDEPLAIEPLTSSRRVATIFAEAYGFVLITGVIGFFVWVLLKNAEARVNVQVLMFTGLFGSLAFVRFKVFIKAFQDARIRRVDVTTVLFEQAVRSRSRTLRATVLEMETANLSKRRFQGWALPVGLAVIPLLFLAIFLLIAWLKSDAKGAVYTFSVWFTFFVAAVWLVLKARGFARGNGISLTEALYRAHRRRRESGLNFARRLVLGQRRRSPYFHLVLLSLCALAIRYDFSTYLAEFFHFSQKNGAGPSLVGPIKFLFWVSIAVNVRNFLESLQFRGTKY